MKKLTALAICSALLLTLTACHSTIPDDWQGDETTSQTTTSTTAVTTAALVIEPAPIEVKDYLHNNFERFMIDGSTSMVPLHQSLNNLFGDSRNIYHRRTVFAFENFVKGETDILLGVSYSDEMLKHAEDSGVDLGQLPITREAFVFLINKNNPVQSLTTQQIKDIYSGKITNWSEVGGDNAPITAFQRNSDSGSQMRMVKFMDNTPLMEKDVRYYEGMGDIIVAIADFDDGKYSIAYNMYTFTEKQYTHNDVMLLSVDGVKPTDKTIFADEYPLVIYNYIYYDKNNPEASEFAENLYIYLMSEEGQRLIGQSGYVTLNVLFDRNLNISKPPSVDNYDDWISFYNKETGEFYEPDGQGGLLVFDNYADFILHDTVYMNHAGGREFLTAIYNSDYRIGPFDAELNNNYIHFTHFWDPAGTATDALLYMYDDMYFYSLSYNFLTGNVELMTAGKEFFDWVFPYLSEKLPEHVDNYEPNVAVIISISDLKNLYLIDYSKSILYGDTPALEYYQPFK